LFLKDQVRREVLRCAQDDRRLHQELPTFSTGRPSASRDEFDEYVSDPAKPVPHISWISTQMTYPYMTGDQRFAASRTDVLVRQTDLVSAGGPQSAAVPENR
jgi:uncharacterized protein